LTRPDVGQPIVAPAALGANELSARFAAAAERAGRTIDATYRIGGRLLRLRYAGAALYERLSPSLEHLRADSDADEHLVEIWDGASTSTSPPPAPDESAQLPPAAIVTSTHGGRRAIYQVGVRTLSVVDTDLDRSWYWASDADVLPEWESSTPLRHILHLWLASNGVQFVHAGAVGRPDGGCIIAGKSGSGKSSTTLATLGSDLLYAGDDYVGVSLEAGGTAYAHSIYGCAKLETDHVARFPDLAFNPRHEPEGALRARRDKTIFYVRETYPRQVAAGFPLKAIIVPRIAPGEETRLTELPLGDALRALVPSTMFEIHAAGQNALTTLTQVAKRVDTFELQLGAHMERIPALLDEALHP
jgi:hypothetical protein